jgi:RND family efflux transporter MFP subunit
MPPNNSDVLRYTPPTRLKLVLLIAALLAAAVLVIGLFSRIRADHEVRQWTSNQIVPTVQLVSAKADSAPTDLILPADVQAYINAPIHSRVNGYLKSWTADIGAKVKKGQLLAEVDTPDLDQQLARAKADLATAKANASLSQTTATRWKGLLAKDAVSQQEYDEKAGDLAAKSSLVNAAAANLAQLQATANYKRITAPFDGVVTSRATDIGALIMAGNPNEAPLFTVAEINRLRVYVKVPQSYAGQIHRGLTAELTAPERPDDKFTATVVSDAQAISTQTGTLLVELQLDNSSGKLKAGSYMQADFHLKSTGNVVRIPGTALITDQTGAHVAILGAGGKVLMRPVTVARDLGQTLLISGGLAPGQKIIDSPPDDLAAGDPVKIAGASAAAPAAS